MVTGLPDNSTARMSDRLHILGINHRSAPVEIREKVVFGPDILPSALKELKSLKRVDETVIVSTCNRTELYCALQDSARGAVKSWLENYHGVETSLDSCLYTLDSHDAVNHAFSVACGLDSMVLGEPQILGQMKDAYRVAREVHSAGPMLNRLFQHAFSVAKQVRTDTKIGESAVSVAYAAVSLARQIFAGFENHSALLIGAGETIELVARYLHNHGIRQLVIANRSLHRARDLAAAMGGFAISLEEIGVHLAEADMVLSSTASPVPVVRKDAVITALKARRHRPMFIVDLAVPRDVEPEVGDLDDVYLYTVDDLHEVIQDSLKSRKAEAKKAEQIIQGEVARFDLVLRGLDAVPTIRDLREQAEAVKRDTLEQAQRMIGRGKTPEEVLDFLANTLTKKLLHAPSQRLREAAEEGEAELVRAARALFNLKKE